MTRQTALPRLENLPEPVPAAEEIVRLIEYAMTQAGAHDRSDQQGVKQRIEKLLADAFPPEELPEDVPA